MQITVLYFESMDEAQAAHTCFHTIRSAQSWAIRYGYSRMGGWAIACSPI